MSKSLAVIISLIFLVSACGPAATVVPPTLTVLPATSPPTVPPTMPPTPTTTSVPTSLPPPEVTPLAVDSHIISAATIDHLERVAAFDLPDSFINSVLFSPDSLALITGDMSGEVRFWERDTWESTTFLPARSQGADDPATGIYFGGTLALSPDGNTIVTAYGEAGEVTGYNREGVELFTFPFGVKVICTDISPDGRYLAVGGINNSLLIYDLATRQPLTGLVSDHEYVSNVVFSSDGRVLLASYERPGNVLKTWDTTTWQETATFTHSTERFDYHDMLFTPDGQEVVFACTQSVEIQFLDLATSQIVREFPDHTRAPYKIAFSPDGSLLASASDDFTVRIWDMETGQTIRTIRNAHEAGAVAFSPDGTLIAFSIWGEGIQVWAVMP
jgi:WD40 repeat protein